MRAENIQPVSNYLRIKLDESPGQSRGGIFLPDDARDRPCSGVVLEAGDGVWKDGVFVKTKIKKGTRVVFNSFALTDGRTFDDQALISEDDVLGVIWEDR